MKVPVKEFSVIYRDKGRWDICSDGKRIYKIRRYEDNYRVTYSCGENRVKIAPFKNIQDCMLFICGILMAEFNEKGK